jgi:hypothetical protein
MTYSSLRIRFFAVAMLLSLSLAACGGGRADAPEHAALTGEQASAIESAGWTLDVAPGRSVGQVAYPTPVLLRDGTTATIAEIANGEPLLLYFFATW